MSKLPGILEVFRLDPELGSICKQIANLLLRENKSLNSVESELVASFTSLNNKTQFCYRTHGEVAIALGADTIATTDRTKQILSYAADVFYKETNSQSNESYPLLTTQDRIHIIEIVSAFLMFNRLVDCINPNGEYSDEQYTEIVKELVSNGYKD